LKKKTKGKNKRVIIKPSGLWKVRPPGLRIAYYKVETKERRDDIRGGRRSKKVGKHKRGRNHDILVVSA
jgi:hypothetical protein